MPRKFVVNGTEHQMSISAIQRVEESFGKSSLQVMMDLRSRWSSASENGLKFTATTIRLGDAFKFLAACTDTSAEQLSEKLKGEALWKGLGDAFEAFCTEVSFLVSGDDNGFAKDAPENPSSAADGSTSGG